MDVKLKLFCTVVETKSFSKTSRIVHLSQPAVSMQIQALEEFFETKLFDRSRDTIHLTSAGEILYKEAKHILKHYTDIEKRISKITGIVKGGITIGASTTIGNYVLPRIVVGFKKKYPRIKITLIIRNTKRIEELLSSQLIDFGLVEGEISKTNFKTEPLIADELVPVVSSFHPWAKKRTLSLLEITREPFIIREAGSGTRQKLEEFFALHGFSINNLHVALTLGSTESIKVAVEGGAGVSILSKWAVRKEIEDGKLHAFTFREGNIMRNFSLIIQPKKESPHTVEEFLLFVKKFPHQLFSPENNSQH